MELDSSWKQCNGPLHKGAFLNPEIFLGGCKTCMICLGRNEAWRKSHPGHRKKYDTWAIPDNRLRQNLRRLNVPQQKKEALSHLLKPGMGWGNYYVKGKRSWRFAIGATTNELEASWG